jgi:hypothetical protein
MSQAHLALGSSLCTGWWLVPSDEVHQLRCADIGPWFRYSLDVVAASWHSRFPSNSLFARLISHQPAVLFSRNEPATSNQPQPASSTLLSEQTSTSHQPTEQAQNV